METQTRLSRHDKFISAENIIGKKVYAFTEAWYHLTIFSLYIYIYIILFIYIYLPFCLALFLSIDQASFID